MTTNETDMDDATLQSQITALRDEQNRRWAAKVAVKSKKQHIKFKWLATVVDGVRPLDILCPEHAKSRYEGHECSDDNLEGVYRVQRESKEYSCVRCKVLWASLEPIAEDASVELEVYL